MSGKRRYRKSINSFAGRKEDKVIVFSGTLGITTNGENQVEVPGRPGYVWVQLRNQLNETIQALNESVSPVFSLPVLVEWDKDAPIRYKVRGRDIGRYTVWVTTNAAGDSVSNTSSYLPAHSAQHSFNKYSGWGGGDVLWVYSDQFMPWAVTPSGSAGSLSVSVQPSAYYYNDQFRWAGGTGIAGLDVLRPTGSSNARMILVYLDPDSGNPYLATGSLTEFANTITGTQQIMPYMPSLIEETDVPLAGIRLITGTNKILWQNLYDLRDYFVHASVSGSSGGGGAPTNAQYVVMALNGTLSDERVLTAGSDVTLTDGGAGGNATVGVATGTFSRAGHGHLYPYSVAIYDDHVFKATGTILDFTGNIDVAATGSSVFISSTAAGGGGSTVLIYDDGAFKVTGSAISFDDNLTVHVTGSTAYVVGQAGGAGGFPIISEDGVFKATGVAIDFGENMNVAVTGSTVFVSSVDTTGGGGGDLLIYDDSAFSVTGTAISFDDNLTVHVTGSIAYIEGVGVTGSVGPAGDNTIQIYEDSIFRTTGSIINFGENLNVLVTGTTAFVSSLGLDVEEVDNSPSISNTSLLKVPERNLINEAPGVARLRSGIDYVTANVSNPPTKSELSSLLGDPATLQAGYICIVNDNGSGSNEYLVTTDGSNWWVVPMALASGAAPTLSAIVEEAIIEYWNTPSAVHFQGTYNRTYFSWISYAGEIAMCYYDHDTRVFSSPVVVHDLDASYNPYAADDHNAPTLYIASDGTINIFYCVHDQNDIFFQKASTNPEDISAWGSATDLTDAVSATQYNYPQPRLLDNGNLFLFYRRGNVTSGIWVYKISTDEGATWGSPTTLSDTTSGAPYLIPTVFGNEIHVAMMYVTGGIRYAAYYFYSDDGGTTWKKRDGTTITIPVDETEADEVFDSGVLYARIHDIVVDSSGKPYIVFAYQDDPNNEYRFAWHDGADWNTAQITTSAVFFGGTTNFYTGGAAIDPDSPFQVYISKKRTKFEIEIWRSEDGGSTWALYEDITDSSSVDNFRPQIIKDYQSPVRLVWCSGIYTGNGSGYWDGYQNVDLNTEITKDSIT